MGNLQELQAELYEWEGLLKHPGWQKLEGYAKTQVNLRVGHLIRGDTIEMVDLIRREYGRGECAGIELFMHVPSVRISELRAELETLVAENPEEDEHERPDTSNDTAAP